MVEPQLVRSHTRPRCHLETTGHGSAPPPQLGFPGGQALGGFYCKTQPSGYLAARTLIIRFFPFSDSGHLGPDASVEVTGLYNPCAQINDFQPGLLKELVGYNDTGELVRRAGIMGAVHRGGKVMQGDPITVILSESEFETLERV